MSYQTTELIAFSAPSIDALTDKAVSYLTLIDGAADGELVDIAAFITDAEEKEESQPHEIKSLLRVAIVAESVEALQRKLRAVVEMCRTGKLPESGGLSHCYFQPPPHSLSIHQRKLRFSFFNLFLIFYRFFIFNSFFFVVVELNSLTYVTNELLNFQVCGRMRSNKSTSVVTLVLCVLGFSVQDKVLSKLILSLGLGFCVGSQNFAICSHKLTNGCENVTALPSPLIS